MQFQTNGVVVGIVFAALKNAPPSDYSVEIFDSNNIKVEREIVQLDDFTDHTDKGEFRHYMMKEIYEQPEVVRQCLQGLNDLWEGHSLRLNKMFQRPAANEIHDDVRSIVEGADSTQFGQVRVVKLTEPFRFRRKPIAPFSALRLTFMLNLQDQINPRNARINNTKCRSLTSLLD